MSDDNKENPIPQEPVPENEDSADIDARMASIFGDDWQWDAAVPETSAEEIVVDELEARVAADESIEKEKEETEEETEEEKSKEVCIVCGKKLGKSPSNLYCDECRKKFLKTNYGVGHIILAFVMVLVAAVGYFVCVSTCQVTSQLISAQSCVNDKRYDDAVNKCTEISNTISTINSGVNAIFSGINENFTSKDWFNEGDKTTKIAIDAYTQTVTINDLSTYVQSVESVYSENDLKSPSLAEVKNCYDFCSDMNTFSNSISDKLKEYIGSNEDGSYDIKYDDAMKYLDGLKADTAAQKSAVNYFKFVTAYYAEKGKDTILGFFDTAYKEAGDFSFILTRSYMGISWEYEDYDKLLELSKSSVERNLNDTIGYYYGVKAYIIKSDFENANTFCDEMRKNNPDGLDYYSIKAEILRREGKFDEAISVCADGNKVGQDAEIYRQQAIAYMLLDKKDSALEAVKTCYDITLQNASSDSGSSVSLECLNTAALICKLCDDDDTYKEIEDLFTNENSSLEKSVTSCIKGDKTFEEIFMNGTGDV